jgi:hypothetical protein
MLGIIYHLPDPLLALEKVRLLTREGANLYVESTCTDEEVTLPGGRVVNVSLFKDIPIMIFARRNGTSYWDPNSKCLSELLTCAEFIPLETQRWGHRHAGQGGTRHPTKYEHSISRDRAV